MRFRGFLVCLGAGLASILAPLAAAQDTTRSSAQAVWLKAHNKARAQFGSAPLTWSSQLEQEAQQWARQLAKEQRMRHAPSHIRNGNGENLWMGSTGVFTASDMISDFVSERVDFKSGRFPHVSRTGVWKDVGHYTQMVWPQTRKVGCAKAPGARFEILVCRYYPAGNRMGEIIAPEGQPTTR